MGMFQIKPCRHCRVLQKFHGRRRHWLAVHSKQSNCRRSLQQGISQLNLVRCRTCQVSTPCHWLTCKECMDSRRYHRAWLIRWWCRLHSKHRYQPRHFFTFTAFQSTGPQWMGFPQWAPRQHQRGDQQQLSQPNRTRYKRCLVSRNCVTSTFQSNCTIAKLALFWTPAAIHQSLECDSCRQTLILSRQWTRWGPPMEQSFHWRANRRRHVGVKEFSVYAVVTKAVHELILSIDFLTEKDCWWDFRTSRIQLHNEWVHLRQRETEQDNRTVYVCANCTVPLGVHAEVPVKSEVLRSIVSGEGIDPDPRNSKQ